MATPKSQTPSAVPTNDALTRFFHSRKGKGLSTAEFVAQGVEYVTDEHLQRIETWLSATQQRIQQIPDSARLRARLTVLEQFLAETASSPETSSAARKEVAFALAYFLDGGDRIPDSVPEYGLLDDALVVEAVIERNGAALRQHWQRMGRDLPDAW